ncbi:MAG: hypothetical protein ACI9WU_000067 [Myxococcota bacterium]
MIVVLAMLAVMQQAPPELVPPTLVGAAPVVVVSNARRDVPHRVQVGLTVGDDGVPVDVTILQGSGPAVDQAVLSEIAKLRFRPATVAGAPVAVRIKWTVLVGGRADWQGRIRRAPEPTPASGDAALAGTILERGTRRPLAGIPVFLPELELTALTDADGRFAFDELPRRRLVLEVPALDHEPARVTVRAGQKPLIIRLQPKAEARYRSVVERDTSDSARIVVPIEQARTIPGTSGDPLKVVEILPGVARPASAGPNAGQLSVRGSAPEDTRFYLDGLPLLQVFHFGGLYSVLQDEWIESVDFRPGGFSVEYGEATGGLLGVRLAPIRDDSIHGHVDINVYHAALMLTAPVSDDWQVGGAFRRSYFDTIVPAVVGDDAGLEFTAAPRYYEYQTRADYRPHDRLHLRLLVFGSDDELAILTDDPSDEDPTSRGFSLRRSFHQVQGALDAVLTPELSVYAGVATSYQQLELKPSTATSLNLTFDPLTLRSNLTWTPSSEWAVRGGLWSTVQRARVETNIPAPTKEGEPAAPISTRETITGVEEDLRSENAVWAEATWRPVEPLQITTGIRGSFWVGDYEAGSLDPRALVRYRPNDSTTLTASAGLYHRAPSPDETSALAGTPNLSTERSVQLGVGLRQRVGDMLTIDLNGFYKIMGDLVTPSSDPLSAVRYTNDGSGFAAGGELMVRLDTRWVQAWASYTLSTSRRVDGPGLEERPFSFDQTHVLSLVAGVDLTAGWRFSTRFRYTTGNPFTPLTAAWYDASADAYVPAEAAPRLSERVPDFLQLDVRVDKRWTFDTWALLLYLELSNVTNRANVEQVGYNFDYSARTDIESLPLVPSLGLRASF